MLICPFREEYSFSKLFLNLSVKLLIIIVQNSFGVLILEKERIKFLILLGLVTKRTEDLIDSNFKYNELIPKPIIVDR